MLCLVYVTKELMGQQNPKPKSTHILKDTEKNHTNSPKLISSKKMDGTTGAETETHIHEHKTNTQCATWAEKYRPGGCGYCN